MSKKIDNYKVFCSDVDDTLAMHDLSEFSTETYINIPYTNGDMTVAKNTKNINLLIKFYKLGYYVIVWSRTGADWAEKVCQTFGIDQYVNLYVTKPLFIADDKSPETWVETLWRNPKEGTNEDNQTNQM